MAHLVLLSFDSGEVYRCTDLNHARARVMASGDQTNKALVEITPEGGGKVTTLEFDRTTSDWLPIS